MCSLSTLKRLDIFGLDLTFEEHSVQSFKTYVGAIMSIITFISIIVIGILFGKEVYERKNPLVASTQEVLERGEVDFKDMEFFFFFIKLESL